jgi:hypothetical protein
LGRQVDGPIGRIADMQTEKMCWQQMVGARLGRQAVGQAGRWADKQAGR